MLTLCVYIYIYIYMYIYSYMYIPLHYNYIPSTPKRNILLLLLRNTYFYGLCWCSYLADTKCANFYEHGILLQT